MFTLDQGPVEGDEIQPLEGESAAPILMALAEPEIAVEEPPIQTEEPPIQSEEPPAPRKKWGNPFRWLWSLRSREHTVLALILGQAVLVLCAVLTCAAAQRIQNDEVYSTLAWIGEHKDRFILSCIIVLMVGEVVYLLTYRPWVSVAVTYPLLMALYIANDIKMTFRGEPFLVTDLASMREAMGMSNHFQVPFKKVYIYAILGFIALLIFAFLLVRPIKPLWRIRISALAVGILVVAFIGNAQIVKADCYLSRIYKKQIWNTKGEYNNNGALLSFIYSIKRSYTPPPEGYGPESVREAADLLQYTDEPIDISAIPSNQRPNIIVVMNESYWNPVFYHNISFNIDPLQPVYDLVKNEGARLSYHLSNQIGGGTSNVEYEFLTGKALRFYAPETNVYQNIIKTNGTNTWSLAWYFKELGYKTLALHPFQPWFWKRNEIYPYLGFDERYFMNDFRHAEIKGEFISDESAALEMIDRAGAHADDPVFLFCVTMQNHGGYWDKYAGQYDIDVSGDLDNNTLNQVRAYSQGIYDSGKMLQQLVDHYKTVERPTYILFFGDHGPSISANPDLFYEDDELTDQDNLNLYSIPMILWSNTGKPLGDGAVLQSSFMMGIDLLEAAGLPLPPQFRIDKYVRDNYARGMTGLYTLNREGRPIYDTSSIDDILHAMALCQYDSYQGKQHVIREFAS